MEPRSPSPGRDGVGVVLVDVGLEAGVSARVSLDSSDVVEVGVVIPDLVNSTSDSASESESSGNFSLMVSEAFGGTLWSARLTKFQLL